MLAARIRKILAPRHSLTCILRNRKRPMPGSNPIVVRVGRVIAVTNPSHRRLKSFSLFAYVSRRTGTLPQVEERRERRRCCYRRLLDFAPGYTTEQKARASIVVDKSFTDDLPLSSNGDGSSGIKHCCISAMQVEIQHELLIGGVFPSFGMANDSPNGQDRTPDLPVTPSGKIAGCGKTSIPNHVPTGAK